MKKFELKIFMAIKEGKAVSKSSNSFRLDCR